MNKTRDMVIITVGRILVVLSTVIYIRIFTTLLTPVEVGKMGLLLSVFSWFSTILMSPVGLYTNRKINEWNRNGTAKKYLFYLLNYSLIVSLIAGFSLITLNKFNIFNINVSIFWIIVIVIGHLIGFTCNVSAINFLNILGKRFWYVLLSIVTIWVGIGLSVFFAVTIKPKVEYWLLGQIVSQVLVFVLSFFLLNRVLDKSNDISYPPLNSNFSLKIIFAFCWPIALNLLFVWIGSQGYRFIFERMAGLEALGLFIIGYGIGSSIMCAFETLFNQYYLPIFYNEISDGNHIKREVIWNKYASVFFPIILVSFLFVALNGTILLKIFASGKFHTVGYLVVWGALAETIRMLVSATMLVSQIQLETKQIILPSLIGGVVTIFSVFMVRFIKIDLFVGVGIALIVGWLVNFIYMYINMKELLPAIRIPWRRIFYAFGLCLPLVSIFLINKILFVPRFPQAILTLIVSGIYVMAIQFILGRKWLMLSMRIQFLDEFEHKLKDIYSRIYEAWHFDGGV